MVKKDSKVLVPPKLLAGAVVLYWGAMVGMPFIALLMAILLEARNWVSYRWDFDEKAYVKSFYVTLFFVAVALMIIRLDDVDITSFSKIIRWSPILAIPIELAQRYGKSDRMFLNTFFYFSRQRMMNDRKEGRPIDPYVLNTGYPYILGVLISATCTDRQDWLVSLGMLLIVVAVMFAVLKERGMRWQRLVWVMPIVVGLSFVAKSVMLENYSDVVKYRTGTGATQINESYDAYSTRLGGLGQVKQSANIQWRLWSEQGAVPAYVHTGVYDKFARMRWRYDFKTRGKTEDQPDGFEDLSETFDSGAGVKVPSLKEHTYVFQDSEIDLLDQAKNSDDLMRVRVRGIGDTETTESVVPAVLGFKVVADLPSADTLPTANPMGVIKLVDRKVIIDYELWNTDQLEGLPSGVDEAFDLTIDDEYVGAIDRLVKETNLLSYESVADKVEAIRAFFIKEFQYNLHFDAENWHFSGSDLERFMLYDRRGHCEYFATTAALMLRRMDGKWEIVDLTPPDWFAIENVDQKFGWWKRFTDSFQVKREDFQVWKSDAANEAKFNNTLIGVGLLLVAWFGIRLWRKRIRAKESELGKFYEGYTYSDEVKRLIEQWQDEYGERPESLTLRQWFSQHAGHLSDGDLSELELVINRHEFDRYGSSKGLPS